MCGVLNPTAAHAACAAAHWQSSQTVWQLLLAQDTVRIPSNGALVTGYIPSSVHRDSYATYAVKTPAAALRQLACCNILATQTSVAQIGLQRCYGSLRGHPGASGVIQRQRLWVEHTASTRAVLPDPDWRGEGKRPSAGDSSTSSNASVDAWDDAAQAERHQGGAAPTKAPVAGQVFQ